MAGSLDVTYSVSLVDVAPRGQEQVSDPPGAGEGGPVQGDVHLYVPDEGVGPLLYEVADDGLVSVLAGPDQRGPAAVVLHVDKVARQLVLTQDHVRTLYKRHVLS